MEYADLAGCSSRGATLRSSSGNDLNFTPGEILRVTLTNLFGKDIPMFSRVKQQTCNPRKPGNLKSGGGRWFVSLHIDASSELQIQNMMPLKLESPVKVEYYPVSKRLPFDTQWSTQIRTFP